MTYHFMGKTLFVQSSQGTQRRVDFPWPVAQVIAINEMLIVRVEPEVKSKDNENVYGIRNDGVLGWKISPRKYVYEDSPYVGMESIAQNIKLYNWDGVSSIVDPVTGNVISEVFDK